MANLGLVQIQPWGLLLVGSKETEGNPKACTNCHMMWKKQKRCAIIGPDIVIDKIRVNGQLYTPVCGLHDAGEPMDVPDSEVMYPAKVLGPEKADATGLEWAKGEGTNCGGVKEGAACKYYHGNDSKGFCQPLQKTVDSDYCCATHDGPSLDWRVAQKLFKAVKA